MLRMKRRRRKTKMNRLNKIRQKKKRESVTKGRSGQFLGTIIIREASVPLLLREVFTWVKPS